VQKRKWKEEEEEEEQEEEEEEEVKEDDEESMHCFASIDNSSKEKRLTASKSCAFPTSSTTLLPAAGP
jgi:hypothetical protein